MQAITREKAELQAMTDLNTVQMKELKENFENLQVAIMSAVFCVNLVVILNLLVGEEWSGRSLSRKR